MKSIYSWLQSVNAARTYEYALFFLHTHINIHCEPEKNVPFYFRLQLSCCFVVYLNFYYIQGDHLSKKPKNVRDFDLWQGNVRDFTKSQEKCQVSIREKISSGKSKCDLGEQISRG